MGLYSAQCYAGETVAGDCPVGGPTEPNSNWLASWPWTGESVWTTGTAWTADGDGGEETCDAGSNGDDANGGATESGQDDARMANGRSGGVNWRAEWSSTGK